MVGQDEQQYIITQFFLFWLSWIILDRIVVLGLGEIIRILKIADYRDLDIVNVVNFVFW